MNQHCFVKDAGIKKPLKKGSISFSFKEDKNFNHFEYIKHLED